MLLELAASLMDWGRGQRNEYDGENICCAHRGMILPFYLIYLLLMSHYLLRI